MGLSEVGKKNIWIQEMNWSWSSAKWLLLSLQGIFFCAIFFWQDTFTWINHGLWYHLLDLHKKKFSGGYNTNKT